MILRRFPYGESSLLVHVLTREHGRLAILAKGAYRPTSGYCGVLDLFDTLRLTWRRPERSELGVLSAGSIATRRRGLSADLTRYRAGVAILELASLAAREGQAETALFELTEAALDLLADGSAEAELITVTFLLHFLTLLGLAPALDACAACGRPSTNRAPAARARFSISRGGLLCPECARGAAAIGIRVEDQPLNVLAVGRSLLGAPIRLLPRVRLDGKRVARLHGLVRRFLEYHLEARPRSWGRSPRSSRKHPEPIHR